MAELWDDAALVSAFNDSLNKYEVKHKKKPQTEPDADASVLEEAVEEEEVSHEDEQEKGQQNLQAEEQQQQQSYSWDPYFQHYHQLYPHSLPYPQNPYPNYMPYYPYPAFPVSPPPGYHCQPSTSSASAPSYESLKAAVLKALSELPADKSLSLDENSNSTEVLMAWFNAGFRTASYLANK